MLRYRLSSSARSDILEILAWSQERFGEGARTRYEALIVAALRDVATQPDRPGSIERPELGTGNRSWHLQLSRERARAGTGLVRHARHFLIYLPREDCVLIGRVLHEAMELVHHLGSDSAWE